jgi:hypothetical protein
LLQQRRRVQSFNHDHAVGFGEVGGEDMDGVTTKVSDLRVQARDLGGGLLILARTTCAPTTLTLKSTQFAKSLFESPGVIEFTNHFGGGSHRR